MTLTFSRTKLGLGLLLVLIAILILTLTPMIVSGFSRIVPAAHATTMVCTPPTGGTPGNPVFDLKADDGYISTPDGNSLYMWGYAIEGGTFQMPGPILCVTQGDLVTVNLTNYLSEPTSIVFPGQTNVTATGGIPGFVTAEAPPQGIGTSTVPGNSTVPGGGTVTYKFVASEPGTYLYESGTFMVKQVEMGLYGALIIRPTMGPNYAYNDASTEFNPNQEYLLLLHDIDPGLHQAVERGEPLDFNHRKDHYWTINGRSNPDTLNDNFVPWLPNQPYSSLVRVEAMDPVTAASTPPALIRYINAGLENHPFHPHGNHLETIAQDGRMWGSASIESFTRTIGSGQTYDLLFKWIDVEGWATDPNSGPLPVTVPGIYDTVFKDGVTFYSGDPDLAEQSDLPVGTTSYNECGEFYYPWHSHALNEVQNFDEGFGGMMTLVRVDPPGGCP